jgi:hypothetical protein
MKDHISLRIGTPVAKEMLSIVVFILQVARWYAAWTEKCSLSRRDMGVISAINT